MRAWRAVLLASAGLIAGCNLFNLDNLPSDNQFLGDLFDAAQGSRDVISAAVRVRIDNQAAEAAAVRLTMRVAGTRVHFSERVIPPASRETVIGPDEADSVLAEVTRLTEPVESLPLQLFSIGTDFRPGDTVVVTIPARPTDNGNENINTNGGPDNNGSDNLNDNGALDNANENDNSADNGNDNGNDNDSSDNDNDNGVSEPLSITIVGLDEDQRINADTPVVFSVFVGGAGSEAIVRVFADPNGDSGDGDEVEILAEPVAGPQIPVHWDTTGLSPGDYEVYAEVFEGEDFAGAGPAPGIVHVNAQPSLVFDSPMDGLMVTLGREFIVAWAGQDDDDDARITILLDPDVQEDGDEVVLRTDVSEDDLEDRQHEVQTEDIGVGEFHVVGIIDDGLSQVVTIGPRVCIVRRQAGRLGPGNFLAHEVSIISGGDDNVAFGTSLDVSRDLDGDGYFDLIAGDPRAFDVSGTIIVQPGIVYYHESQEWPRELNVQDLALKIIGEQDGALTGERVAFVDGTDDGVPVVDIGIGAPQFLVFEQGTADGRFYLLRGAEARNFSAIHLAFADLRLSRFDGFAEEAGLDVAALGDLNGDGVLEFGVGAASPFGSYGGIAAFVSTADFPDSAPLNLAGLHFDGGIAYSLENAGRVGHSIRGVPDIDGDQRDEVMLGAPLTLDDREEAVGAAYLLMGDDGVIETCGGKCGNGITVLDEIRFGEIRGHVFVGEQPGSLTGYATTSGDYDGDGVRDFVIAAPGYESSAGRVYLVYGGQEFGAVIELGTVGEMIDGAVFDGAAVGDQLGFSLATCDFDADGHDDLVVGAPGQNSSTGRVILLYGGTRWSGPVPILQAGTCDLPGLAISGPEPLARFGACLSSGEARYAGRTVLGVGSPGTETPPGRAYLFFGAAPR